jgi:hypothetical protein
VPDDRPVRRPDPEIEAIEGFEELHTPPGTASVNNEVEPIHAIAAPLIVAGVGVTVMVKDAAVLPQLFAIV